MPTDLAQSAIDEIKSHARHGITTRMICPVCAADRKPRNRKLKEMTVKVDPTNEVTIYNCHHCGESGGLAGEGKQRAVNGRAFTGGGVPVTRPPVSTQPVPVLTGLTDQCYTYLDDRGWDKATADVFNLFSDIRWFKKVQGERPAIGLPYVNVDGEITFVKYRASSTDGLKDFTANGTPTTPFGYQFLVEGEDVYITEGELDVGPMYRSGFKTTCSVPSGAPDPVIYERRIREGKAAIEDDDRRFAFLWDIRAVLDKAKRVYICTDTDEPGDLLAEELARRIGKVKCWRVRYGEEAKDATDLFKQGGVEALTEAVKNAEAWKIGGLYEANEWQSEVNTLYENGLPIGASVGLKNVDDLYKVHTGEVTLVTGIPGSGKSEFIDQVMVSIARDKGWRFAVWSPENGPEYHITKLMQKHVGRPFFQGPHQRMGKFEKEMAFEWVDNHFKIINHDDGGMTSIDVITDLIRAAVLRYGVNGVVIDPWNFIAKQGDVNETEWVSEALTKLKLLAKSCDIHVWVIAHPRKMDRSRDGVVSVPTGYDVSGSANFFNKVDNGVTVHRDVQNSPSMVQIVVWKIRFNWVGQCGTANIKYIKEQCGYSDDFGEDFEDDF